MSRHIYLREDAHGNIQAKLRESGSPAEWDGRGALDLHMLSESPTIGIIATAALTQDEARELSDFLSGFANDTFDPKEWEGVGPEVDEAPGFRE